MKLSINGEDRWFKGLWTCQGLLAGLSISETADLYFHTQTSLEFISSVGENVQLMSEENGKTDWADRKTSITQIRTRYTWGLKKSISEHTTRQTLKQKKHTGDTPVHWGYNSHELTKTGQIE